MPDGVDRILDSMEGVSPTDTARLRRTLTGMRRVGEIARLMLSAADVSSLFATILDSAIELTGAERGLYVRPAEGRFEVLAGRHLDQKYVDHADAKVSRGVLQQVAETGKLLVVPDAAKDARIKEHASVRALPIRSLACVPVRQEGRVVGVLYLEHRTRNDVFREEDAEVLESLAALAEIALQTLQRQAQKDEELRRAETRLIRKQKELELRYAYPNIIGRAPALQEALSLVDKVTAVNVPVLLMGETGTGKELFARALHYNSPRKEREFVAVNCGALPESLLESQLFGHVKGSFTGADRDQVGLLVTADEGTLFLDEIGEMSPALQAKLLRVLQDGEVRPVGASATVKVNVRLVAATNRDLGAAVKKGEFRDDLYYRINAVTVQLPPLRRRVEDIPLLAKHFLHEACAELSMAQKTLAPETVNVLASYMWKGNIRELANEMRRVAALGGDPVKPNDLSARILDGVSTIQAPAEILSLEEAEGEHIRRVLAAVNGDTKRAAELLGVDASTLWRKRKKFGIP